MENNKGTMKGVLIGGIVGAAAALLLAPKSGKELRGDIKDKYGSVHERASQLVKETGRKTQELAKQVGDQASNIADKTRSAITAAKDEAMQWKDEHLSNGKTN
ncbi:YtxH domain-containing protein [Cohnella sp. GCM10027633]|uniref:YtxH domain-containing protein n=1 Tax=unclassified Cohnella TaxID=2636738 RepID=UPI003637F1D7